MLLVRNFIKNSHKNKYRPPFVVAFGLVIALLIFGVAGGAGTSQASDVLGFDLVDEQDQSSYDSVGDGVGAQVLNTSVVTHDRSGRRLVDVEIEISNTSEFTRRFPKSSFILELSNGRVLKSERTTQDGNESRLVVHPGSRVVGHIFFGYRGKNLEPANLMVSDPLRSTESDVVIPLAVSTPIE